MADSAQEKLVLREDDQVWRKRLGEANLNTIRILRTTLLATPILVGIMHHWMRNLPKDVFPPGFWTNALMMPLFYSCLIIGFSYPQYRFIHRKCTMSPKGVSISGPEGIGFLRWSAFEEWRMENSREHPGHFTVGFYYKHRQIYRSVIVPNTYSRDEVRAYILRHAPLLQMASGEWKGWENKIRFRRAKNSRRP